MKTNPFSELAEALCENDSNAKNVYAVHRQKISDSLAKLRRRERCSRIALMVVGLTWFLSLLGLMGLERLPPEVLQRSIFDFFKNAGNVLLFVSSIAFPALSLMYLLRHLPNWLAGSQRENEQFLKIFIKQQQSASTSTPPSKDSCQSDSTRQ